MRPAGGIDPLPDPVAAFGAHQSFALSKEEALAIYDEIVAGLLRLSELIQRYAVYYAASTMICVPTSLDQPVGAALGAQAGLKLLSSAISEGGFSHIRKATATPFNMILEARP